MELIKKFEDLDEQTVKAFNKLFKSTPILGCDDSSPVRIGEVCPGDERRLFVGDMELTMCLIQRKAPKKALPRSYKAIAFDRKACNKCGVVKEFSEFYPHRTSKGGVRADCKECCIKVVTKWKNNNALKIKQQDLEKSAIKKLTRNKK